MSEHQDRPTGRARPLPGDRPVAGMPSDDAVEGRVVGSPDERTDRPGEAPAGQTAKTTTPQPTGPVAGDDGYGPLPGRGTDREQKDAARPGSRRGERPGAPTPAGRQGERPEAQGAPGAHRDGATGSDEKIEPGSPADPLGERTAGPSATVRSYAHGASSAPAMSSDTGSSPDLDDEPGRHAADRLIGRSDADRFETRWHEVKAGFVDDPRDSVKQASALCEEAVRALTATLDQQRRDLEQRWKGDGVDTERMRTALRAYGELLQRFVSL